MADTATAPAPVKTAEKPRFSARLRYARISARKMRYVVDLVRGKDFNSAIAILRVCSRRGAPFCKKLLESAAANAIDFARAKNLDIDANSLHLVEARVDGGPIIKRWRPSSTRRPTMIKKRMCHVTFILEERELKESKKDRSKRKRQDRQKAKKSPSAKAAGDKAGGAVAAKPASPGAKAPEAKPSPPPAGGDKPSAPEAKKE
ncbi:MAG TPA: 50S ribosomal protein L22 [Planctomycetota bacterium]|jgi:large subunit ribosomal protein L22